MFTDRVKIFVKGGDGGAGALSFRREKFVPRGGPDGGNGGRGGNVILEGSRQGKSLQGYRFKHHFPAGRGGRGGGSRRHGKDAIDIVLPVPPGTLVKDEEGKTVADLVAQGQRLVVAKGGRGGRGNASFKTSTRQTPRFAELGEPGQSTWLWLELRLIADVGLLGLPNPGKSTLLSAASAAKPKIADYPFTTLEPVLGVVELAEDATFVMADLPALIEGGPPGGGARTCSGRGGACWRSARVNRRRNRCPRSRSIAVPPPPNRSRSSRSRVGSWSPATSSSDCWP